MRDNEEYPLHSLGHQHHLTSDTTDNDLNGCSTSKEKHSLSSDTASLIYASRKLTTDSTSFSEKASAILSASHSRTNEEYPDKAQSPPTLKGDQSSPSLLTLPPSPLVTPPGGFFRNDSVSSNAKSVHSASLSDLAEAAQVTETSRKKRVPVPHVYHDYGNIPIQRSALDTRKKTGGVTVPFPEKLHKMLNTETGHIVCWLPHGRAFCVRKPKDFTALVMPK